jgi:ATP-dependent RNA helicase RhlE
MVAMSRENRERPRFLEIMLRKIIAKLRETITPSAKAKKPAAGSHSSSSPRSSSRDRSRGQPGKSAPRDASRSHERSADRPHDATRGESRSHGGQSSRGGRSRRDDRHSDRPAHSAEPRQRREPTPAPPPPDVPKMDTAFSKLGLADALAYAVEQKGYTEPTPIQAQAIPIVLTGRDVMGSAQTGTGKTAAFALPVLQRLGTHGRLRCLVLEPTRELALQVEEAFRDYSKFTNQRVAVVYGGVGYGKQIEALDGGIDIMVATPGRLLDHLEQGNTSLRDVQVLVLDEVDRMLDMGFLPDVKRIVQKCPTERQTLFFSATMPPELAQLASWAVRDPARIEIGLRRSPAETVSHAFYPVVEAQKFDLLKAMLERTNFESVIIFCRTKVGADRVASWLTGCNHAVGVMHSDRSQGERTEALAGFKSGKYSVLVATDIAARGLDIAGVTHVINYDVPENPEDYVHRIGRTGRAQKTGEAFTIVGEDDVRHARSIERFIDSTIERKRLENFPYTYSALFTDEANATATKPASRLAGRLRR